jgi:zinc transporter 7
MLLQLLTAVGAFIGCAVAVNSVDGQKWGQDVQSSWVMPFTAGGFIYIATVTVLPDLLKKSTFWLTVGEVLAMSVGVVAMYLIGFLEHVPYDEALAYVKRFV